MLVGDERAHDWLAGVIVVSHGGGQGQDALDDPGGHAAGGVPAVAFEVELAFESVVDRSMIRRSGLKNRVPGRWGSPWRAGRSKVAPTLALDDPARRREPNGCGRACSPPPPTWPAAADGCGGASPPPGPGPPRSPPHSPACCLAGLTSTEVIRRARTDSAGTPCAACRGRMMLSVQLVWPVRRRASSLHGRHLPISAAARRHRDTS